MAEWDANRPTSMMERLQAFLQGDKPTPLKAEDEYGRAVFDSEAPADTEARLKENDNA